MPPENYGIDNVFYYCEVGKEDEMKPISNCGFKEMPTIQCIDEEKNMESSFFTENLSKTQSVKIKVNKLTSIKLKELFYYPIDYRKIINRRKKFGKRRNMRWK